MAFPSDPLDGHIELFYDGTWDEITDDVNMRDDIVITRGRQDEATQAGPSRCSLQLNNTGGKYSPRNPLSPLFGKIGRNTPLRVRVGNRDAALTLPGVTGSYASTPDAASLDITGDIDVRIELEPDTWRPSDDMMFAAKVETGQVSWMLRLSPTGALQFSWSATGGSVIHASSTVSIAEGTGSLAVRATLDADDGAGNRIVTFYTAPTLSGAWTQLGGTVGGAATSIFAGTAELSIGATNGGDVHFAGDLTFAGRVHAFQLRNGINGTLVADPDFTAQPPDVGGVTFTDSVGLAWTELGQAHVEDRSVRFCGEVISWPPRWDSDAYVWVPIEASGVRRRLAQGSDPLGSPMRRAVSDLSSTVPLAYWPCEDGSDATRLASASGGPAMTLGLGPDGKRDTNTAAYDGFAASGPLPEFHFASAFGWVPAVAGTGELRVMCLMHIPEGGMPGTRQVLKFHTSGTVRTWAIEINSAGNYRIVALSWDSQVLVGGSFGSAHGGFNGKDILLSLRLLQNGSNIDYQSMTFEAGDPTGIVGGGTLAGRTFGHALSVTIGSLFDVGGTALGHVAVYNRNTDKVIWEFAGDVLTGWTGEQAADRIERVAAEENVALVVTSAEETEKLGKQGLESTLELLDGAAASDGGVLSERRDLCALQYRPRASLYNQTALELDYKLGHVSAPFEPTDDDEATVNDVTVSRDGGASTRAVKETGPLSINPPPDGVGRYDSSVGLSLHSDGQTVHQAGWKLHLGTVDEARFPAITVLLHANPDLIGTVTELDSGDRVKVLNTPTFLPPGGADVIVQGYTEVLNSFQWAMSFNCTPASPWTVGVAEDDVLGRADTAGSELVSDFVAGVDTSMTVNTTVGPPWTTDPAEFPFDIVTGGVELRVTGISGDGWAPPVSNQGFETNITGWSIDPATAGGSVSRDTTKFRTGVASLKVTPDGTATEVEAFYSPTDIPVTAGKTYTVSLWTVAGPSSGGVAACYVMAYWNNSAGAFISSMAGLKSVLSASGWDRKRITVTAPTGAAFIRMGLAAGGETMDAVDEFWIDDVEVAEVSPARETQTFTVDQAPVNGVQRTIPAGSDVRLAHPMIISL